MLWLVALPVYAAGIALASWWVMLLLGAVHLSVFTWVPALGFSQTVLVVLLLSALGAAWNTTATLNRN